MTATCFSDPTDQAIYEAHVERFGPAADVRDGEDFATWNARILATPMKPVGRDASTPDDRDGRGAWQTA